MWVLPLDFRPCFNYSRGLCLSLSRWLLPALLRCVRFNCRVFAERKTERGSVPYSCWPPTTLQLWRPAEICLFNTERLTGKYSGARTMRSFFPSGMEIFFIGCFLSFFLSFQQIDLCDIIYCDRLPELLQFQEVKRARRLLKSQHLRCKIFTQSLHLKFIIRLVAGIC